MDQRHSDKMTPSGSGNLQDGGGRGELEQSGGTTSDLQTLRALAQKFRRKAAEGLINESDPEMTTLRKCMTEAWRKQTGGRIEALCNQIGLWRRAQGFQTHWQNVPEKLMLIVTEVSEAMEALRYLRPDFISALEQGIDRSVDAEQDCILKNFEEELADAVIRIADLSEALRLDLESAIYKKMAKNETRPNKHGKQC